MRTLRLHKPKTLLYRRKKTSERDWSIKDDCIEFHSDTKRTTSKRLVHPYSSSSQITSIIMNKNVTLSLKRAQPVHPNLPFWLIFHFSCADIKATPRLLSKTRGKKCIVHYKKLSCAIIFDSITADSHLTFHSLSLPMLRHGNFIAFNNWLKDFG